MYLYSELDCRTGYTVFSKQLENSICFFAIKQLSIKKVKIDLGNQAKDRKKSRLNDEERTKNEVINTRDCST